MKILFENYKKLLEERLSHKPLLLLGEDSIRYDFFSALIETYNLRPHEIDIEVPLNNSCFIPIKNQNSKRNEKPLIDLVVKNHQLQISAEFGLFRQNSNDKGTINKTARIVKMVNDMLRSSLEAKFTNTMGLFICIADNKIIGHKLRSGFLEKFPANYLINKEFIEHQINQKTNKIDKRFLDVFLPLDKSISADIIYDAELKSQYIKNETRLIIWETKII